MPNYIEFIKTIARKAGEIALTERLKLNAENIHAKGTDIDMVTDVDRKVEAFLFEAISKEYPTHGFHGEETGITRSESEFRWVVDPIDGTTSYIHDFHFYAVSIALQQNGQTIAAVVYAPKLDELFSAVKNEGAELNGKKIKVSKRPKIRECLLATGFACLRAKHEINNLPKFNRIMPELRGIRRTGSAALDLCNVACGRFDGFWEFDLQIYDIAAGQLIVEEAGGLITDFVGGDQYPSAGMVATNGLIHDELLYLLRD